MKWSAAAWLVVSSLWLASGTAYGQSTSKPLSKSTKPAAGVPQTTEAFKKCFDDNYSPIFPGNTLVLLCLDRHEKPVPERDLEASGAYFKDEKSGETFFVVKLKNMSSDTMLTRLVVMLRHSNAREAQALPVGPMSLLPGQETAARLAGLTYVPREIKTSGPPDFQFSIQKLAGLTLKLR
jgi:hypothetical protein